MLPKLCSIPECGKKFYCKTFCRMHYRRLREYGNPYTSRAQIKANCEAPDCVSKQHAHGYCTTHLYHFQAYGDPFAVGPGRQSGRKRMTVPSYAGMHKRLFYDKGKASARTCVDCGIPAQEWSYDGGCSDEQHEVLVKEPVPYTTDQSKYSPRCIRCHRGRDLSGVRFRDKSGRYTAIADQNGN